MFENFRVFETELAGKKISFETGKMACLANGSVLVRWGETVVLCNVTASPKPREGIDFFPLSVDFEEKLYSVGKIPGSFLKREGRPSQKAILTSRLVDRPIRPLFPKDMRNDVSVVMTVLSVDQDYSPEVAGMLGTSFALSISDIPWNGPIGGVQVGLVDGEIIVCPNEEQRSRSDLQLTVAGTREKIVMIEAGANEVDNETMLDAIAKGHEEIKKIAQFIADVQAEIDECIYKLQKFVVRRWLLDEGKRVDGRGIDEIRPLACEVGLIPRVHGSALFTRGQTQVMTITTLGPISDAQILDGIDNEETKRYMHQYNFPSYSVGETKPSRGPGRREIGHGALAERALEPVIPPVEEFPYAYRLVSEVLSSNGSTSQASICASTLSLMDAGVPIKAPVAGISCGLITEGDRWMTMVDIQGLEDFFGDMDFKVGGTHKGITAIQVDIKIDGLTLDIIRDAFEKTRKARIYILDEIMLKAIDRPRPTVNEYAPKMVSLKIPVDKIREVIGSGGKVIQKICAECDVKIDIEENGDVFVSGIKQENVDRAVSMIETIARDPEVGAFYKGRVTRLMNFGAFVEIAPGKEGLVHISKLDTKRVEKVEDVVNVDDEILVKVTDIDSQGRINLSRKDALIAMENKQKKHQ